MSLAELVIVSVKVEGRSKSEVAREYKISRYWVQQLVKRYEAEGQAAFVPRSRRPHTNPRALDPALEDRIVRLRKELSKQGLDAGAETIRAHLHTAGAERVPSVSTIWRVLTRRGFVTPQPHKGACPGCRDRADTSGVITIRYDSRLHHIGLGREHARTRVLALRLPPEWHHGRHDQEPHPAPAAASHRAHPPLRTHHHRRTRHQPRRPRHPRPATTARPGALAL